MTVAELARVVDVLTHEQVRVLLALLSAGGHQSVLSFPNSLREVIHTMVEARLPLVEWRKSGTELWLTPVGCEVVTVWEHAGQTAFVR